MVAGQNTVNEYAVQLSRKIWITRGSRFNGAQRLQNKNRFSTNSISILSIYGIAISLLQLNSKILRCVSVNETYTFIAIILSVFTLVLSLLEGYQDYQSRAQRLYQNAVSLSKLLSELDYAKSFHTSPTDFVKTLKLISDEYEQLVRDCPENHSTKDFELFQVQNSKEFKIARFMRWTIRVKLLFLDYWTYIFSILSLPVLIGFLFIQC